MLRRIAARPTPNWDLLAPNSAKLLNLLGDGDFCWEAFHGTGTIETIDLWKLVEHELRILWHGDGTAVT